MVMDISSIIIETRPEMTSSVLEQLRGIAQLEIQQPAVEGKIIALIETEDPDSAVRINKRIASLPGVINVFLIYHYYER